MELALLFMVLSLVELALTVWLLARHRDYVTRVTGVEMRLQMLDDLTSVGARSPEPVASISDVDLNEEQYMQVLEALKKKNDGR